MLAVAALLVPGAAWAQSGTPAPGTPAANPSTSPATSPTAPAATAAPAAGTPATGTPPTGTPTAGSGVEISDRAYAIARQLRCPVCTAESVADSNAEIAGEMRRLIQQQLDAGKSQEQIVSYFRQRYGDWILLDPPKTGLHLVVWLLPLLALLGGAAALALLVRRWRKAAETTPDAPDEDLQRVRAALRAREEDA